MPPLTGFHGTRDLLGEVLKLCLGLGPGCFEICVPHPSPVSIFCLHPSSTEVFFIFLSHFQG